MLFNSVEFAIFLPVVFFLYWAYSSRNRAQLIVILLASYLFYGWWDWRFLGLIILSSFVDFMVGWQLGKADEKNKRKLLLAVSLITNLGLLGFFKYFNFFTETFANAFTFFGNEISSSRFNIILPVGISFYTFQTLSYTFDVYRRTLKPTKDWLSFFSYVSFFPQLVAGPIERASHLLAQFQAKRNFNYDFAVSGIRLFIWGMFKKVVIADNAAILVNPIFESYETQSSISLIFGAVLFAFQIYGDFSGYSDMAVGLSRIFGFDLMLNFRFPYLAQNVNDFWKRWHISLSTWFRDYLYLPLGGSRGSILFSLRNVMIVFLVSGFWHGANWTFIVWGLIHGLMYIPLFIKKSHQNIHDRHFIKKIPGMVATFSIVTIAWIFFRADSISEAFNYLSGIISNHGAANIVFSSNQRILILIVVLVNTFGMLGIEAFFEQKQKQEVLLSNFGLVVILLAIFFFGAFQNHEDFIYFQF